MVQGAALTELNSPDKVLTVSRLLGRVVTGEKNPGKAPTGLKN